MFLKGVRVLEVVLMFFIGLIIGIIADVGGYLIIKQTSKTDSVGILMVDRSDPDDPHLYLELNDADWYAQIVNQSEVTFLVKFKD